MGLSNSPLTLAEAEDQTRESLVGFTATPAFAGTSGLEVSA